MDLGIFFHSYFTRMPFPDHEEWELVFRFETVANFSHFDIQSISISSGKLIARPRMLKREK